MTEYISKKISREGDKILKYVQAHYQLEKGEKTTENEVLEMALGHIAEEKYEYKQKITKKYKLSDIIGLSKSKLKSREQDIDRVVYGV